MNKDNKVYYVPKDSPVYPNRFDTRIRLRSLTRGLLSQTEVTQYLTDLPDDASNAEVRNYSEVVDEADDQGNGLL
jgi:hypothetical protein